MAAGSKPTEVTGLLVVKDNEVVFVLEAVFKHFCNFGKCPESITLLCHPWLSIAGIHCLNIALVFSGGISSKYPTPHSLKTYVIDSHHCD